MNGFPAYAAAAAVAAGSVALLESARGPRAAWTLAFIIAIGVYMARDPDSVELRKLTALVFPAR